MGREGGRERKNRQMGNKREIQRGREKKETQGERGRDRGGKRNKGMRRETDSKGRETGEK